MTVRLAKQAGGQGQKQAVLGQKQTFWRNLTVVPVNLVSNPYLWEGDGLNNSRNLYLLSSCLLWNRYARKRLAKFVSIL